MQSLRVILASPSDVQPERDMLAGVIEELNRGIGEVLGVDLKLYRWETDAYPGFHPDGPQGLIDPILRIDECDILIGIFWKRFGTPTKDANSGTEHEFRMAYEAWRRNQRPHIMVYFKDKPYAPQTREEIEQWGQVLDFKEVFPKEGLWWPFTETDKFRGLVCRHLSNWLIENFYKEETPRRTNRSSKITQQLNQDRREEFVPPFKSNRITIDKNFIIDYNLDELVRTFKDTLDYASISESDYEGTFVFSINGDDYIVKEFILERILKELHKKTSREHIKHDIYLSPTALDLDRTLKSQLRIDHFKELFEGSSYNCPDIVLVVWNKLKIPQSKFFELATEFWSETQPQIVPYLSNPSRCFVMLWADVNVQPVRSTQFTQLIVPDYFDLPKLFRWLGVGLRDRSVNESHINSLIKKIKSFNGESYCTYCALKDELQLLGR